MHTTDIPSQKFANEFDFFMIHFQEEFSALSGDLLQKQTEYVNECVKYILGLYHGEQVKLTGGWGIKE
jgi:hypothetical protein